MAVYLEDGHAVAVDGAPHLASAAEHEAQACDPDGPAAATQSESALVPDRAGASREGECAAGHREGVETATMAGWGKGGLAGARPRERNVETTNRSDRGPSSVNRAGCGVRRSRQRGRPGQRGDKQRRASCHSSTSLSGAAGGRGAAALRGGNGLIAEKMNR